MRSVTKISFEIFITLSLLIAVVYVLPSPALARQDAPLPGDDYENGGDENGEVDINELMGTIPRFLRGEVQVRYVSAAVSCFLKTDEDGDGIYDGWEGYYGLDPTLPDADKDPDGDGFTNKAEFDARTDPQDLGSVPTPKRKVVINEVMFDPWGVDAGNEWFELYNMDRGTVSLKDWVITNKDADTIADLPDWTLPSHTYLVVYFGEGTDDSDFSDGSGSFYAGTSNEVLSNTEDEVALYAAEPSTETIVDFISWGTGGYEPGTAHDYAVSAGIWDSGAYFDIGFPTGKSILGGDSIGRDKNSTDTNKPNDWDSTGGVDAYYPTPGAENTGPLYSVSDGIKLTQLKVNLFLIQWEYRITYASHTILQELQTDDETYVKATHHFKANLDGIENSFTGVGEYHWHKVDSSAWKEEINFLLSTPDSSESFSMSYTKELITNGLTRTINESASGTYSYETFEIDQPYPDDEFIPDPPVRVVQENYTSGAYTTITQTDSNRYYTEVAQQVNDRGLIWDISFVRDKLILSDTEVESWTNLTQVNNMEDPHAIITHYNASFGEGWHGGGIGEINVSYQNYSVTLGDKTFLLDEPGYVRMEEVNNGSFDIACDIDVASESETLDLGSSGHLEVLTVGEEIVLTGSIKGNASPKIYQFYIDGTAGAVGGGALCAGIGFGVTFWLAEAPPLWVAAGCIVGGAVCGAGGNAMEPDTAKPDIQVELIDKGSDKKYGWATIKITVEDDSGFSNYRDKVIGVKGKTLGGISFGPGTKVLSTGQLISELRLRNAMCVDSPQTITVTATDNSAAKNSRTDSKEFTVPARDCSPNVEETDPENEQSYVPVDKNIKVTFCKPMDRDSVEKALTISPPIDYTISWSEGDTTIVLGLAHDLTYNTNYVINIGTDAMSVWGYHLEQPYTFSFTTAKDTIAPVLEIASPLPHDTVSDIVKIKVEVEDNVDPAPLAEFIVDGVSIGYDETPPYEYIWDASHQEIGTEHTITVKVTDESGNTTEAVVTVEIGPEEPTAVTASGQHLQAVFAPADIDSVELAVEETPAPYKPERWESRASVSDWTEGFLILSYTDVNGESVWVEQGILINNTTREIVGEMIDVGVETITVGAIFGPLPSVSGEEDMTLTLDFSYPISIAMGPVFELQLQAGVNKYVTDKGKEVEVSDDGWPHLPDATEAEADAVLDALGLKDKVEKKAGPSDSYDCHGWTFTCGKKWINNDQVQKKILDDKGNVIGTTGILDDNGYSKTTKPQVGDIAVYRDSNGDITHTGIVREVDENGNVVDVESKWGAYGRYDHKPGDVPPEYGTPEYHHTDRPGEGEGKDRHTIKTE